MQVIQARKAANQQEDFELQICRIITIFMALLAFKTVVMEHGADEQSSMADSSIQSIWEESTQNWS